jgi:hypothetical protein
MSERLYHFHVNLFALPVNIAANDAIKLRGVAVTPIDATFSAFLPVSFEQALDALKRLPRLDAEPDGFFVISGDERGVRWQVDGHLFDFNDRLHRIELHGQCPPAAFDDLLRCFGWSAQPLAFELVQEGVAMDETAFRQWAAALER